MTKKTTTDYTSEEIILCPSCHKETHGKICPECGYNFSKEELKIKSKYLMIMSLVSGCIGFIWGALMGMFSSNVNDIAYSMGKNLGVLGVILWFTPIVMIIAMPIFFIKGLIGYIKSKLKSKIKQ